ncbi:MAG: hypothetical protein DHS20C11_08040 [Lysobacteraceae bacterium]|nr:MAG: hypothetical protein DHS20C11_08040 [Xanthomonadaceae bacterium]
MTRSLTSILIAALMLAVPCLLLARTATAELATDPLHSPTGRYIVLLDGAPLFDANTAPNDFKSATAQRRKQAMDDQVSQLLADFQRSSKSTASVVHQYRYAVFGFAAELSHQQAKQMRSTTGVIGLVPDRHFDLLTDAGPAWIGAPAIWSETGNHGEGIVIGVIDSGINFLHPSFADIGGDGYDHSNPRGRQFGLCSTPQVSCNDKLIGVYDFSSEGSMGADTDGHGSHVAATAAGNFLNATIAGNTSTLQADVSGVAPHANIISYKACEPGDDGTTCPFTALVAALDQALADNVDVINYSIGGDERDPWSGIRQASVLDDAEILLNLRQAGVLTVVAAGNEGPGPGTILSPANAPWVVAAANLSHDRVFANPLTDLQSNQGDLENINGVGQTASYGPAPIVHAADFGFPLCGIGSDVDFPPSGASNPFAANTFNGQIVVCDRGIYARVTKGFNVLQAGAGGYVLANSAAEGDSIVVDDHFLPGTHITFDDGETLRAWLAEGDGHMATINGQFADFDASYADRVSSSSSRGPGVFIPELMKPNIGAPGSSILAADLSGSDFTFKSGTSMATPHIAGAAALIRAAHPEWTVDQVQAALEMTAVTDGVTAAGRQAQAYDSGAGRIQVDRAIEAGLYLRTTKADFVAADPQVGGQPGALNLSGMVNEDCFQTCTFTRTVRSSVGASQWQVDVEGPDGLQINVTPSSFQVGANGARQLTIEVDVSDGRVIGDWVYANVWLRNTDTPRLAEDVKLTVNVFAPAGPVPERFELSADASNRGRASLQFEGLAPLNQASFSGPPLTPATVRDFRLGQDPTPFDSFDSFDVGNDVTIVSVVNTDSVLVVEANALNGADIDIFVGRDSDEDGLPSRAELVCESTSPNARESCAVGTDPGNWWILVQNWGSITGNDLIEMTFGVAGDTSDGVPLMVAGPGKVAAGQPFVVDVAYEAGEMQSGETWLSALRMSAHDDAPGQFAVVPLIFDREVSTAGGTELEPDLSSQPAYPLVDGQTSQLTLASQEGHGRLFIDVPPGTSKLTARVSGSDGQVDLFAVGVDANHQTPDIEVMPGGISGATHAVTNAGNNPVLRVQGTELTPGRWYIAPVNRESDQETSFGIKVTLQQTAAVPDFVYSAWSNPAGFDGLDMIVLNGRLFIGWFAWDEQMNPVWYLADAPVPEGAVFSAKLLRFTFDGQRKLAAEVGTIIVTFEAEDSAVLSWHLMGQASSQAIVPLATDYQCTAGNSNPSGVYSALLTGMSVFSVPGGQGVIAYIFDQFGVPVWVHGGNNGVDDQIDALALFGPCPQCQPFEPSRVAAGQITRNLDQLTLDMDISLPLPLQGDWSEQSALQQLSPPVSCN